MSARAKPGRVDRLGSRYEGSHAERFVKRLIEMDVINRGRLFAAILFLCFFPFPIILSALSGGSAVNGFVHRLGLNQQASTDVTNLFAPASSTSSSVTGGGYVLFVLAALAAAAAVQNLYLRAFEG